MNIAKRLLSDFRKVQKVSINQDVDIFYSKLEEIMLQRKELLIEGFFNSGIHQQAVHSIVNKYKIFINSVFIQTANNTCQILLNHKLDSGSNDGYKDTQQEYDSSYYSNDCGGYPSSCDTGGQLLEQRLGE